MLFGVPCHCAQEGRGGLPVSTAAPNVVRQGEFVACLTQNLGGPPVDRVIEQMGGAGLQGIKAVVTWRGVVAHEDVCFVRLALEYLDLLQKESCGRCTPCRIGTQIMRRILHRLRDGEASPADLEELRALAEQIDDSSWCGIGNTIRDPLLGLLEVGRRTSGGTWRVRSAGRPVTSTGGS